MSTCLVCACCDMGCTSTSSRSTARRRSNKSRPTSSISRRSTSAMSLIPLLFCFVLFPGLVASQVTVYTAVPQPSYTETADPSAYTGLPAYDPTRLTAPAPPQPPVTQFTLTLPVDAAGLAAANLPLSIPQQGNFLGFSIELSVAESVLGRNGNTVKTEFLNYMANIKNRAGRGPLIRVGGNTQDTASIYPEGFPDGSEVQKVTTGQDRYGNAINTPVINFSPEIFNTMSNISSLVDAEWYFGIAFKGPDISQLVDNVPLTAQYAQDILGSRLRGLVVGNEPDLYVDHNHRPAGWGVSDYMNEYDTITQRILSDNVLKNTTAFVGPSLCCQEPGFELQNLLDAGYLSTENAANIVEVTVQHYPTNNCQLSGVINAQDIFAEFLNHTSAQSLTAFYQNDVNTVRSMGKDVVMLEMNSASCGGFAGLSDSFGVAMWMTDWTLQMAYYNFSAALMHVGGQNVYYNPFTPPPSSVGSNYQWTTGSVYYPSLVVAEIFGQSGASQIVDLNANNGDIYHPAYAIYENNEPTRVVLFNYVSDESGQSTHYTTINLANDAAISQTVSVRYFSASSVSEQYDIFWANQTMGRSFMSDGKLTGQQVTVTITCDNNACVIPVYAPSIAVVFLDEQALQQSSPPQDQAETFSTTIIGQGAATVAVGALQTGNGGGSNGRLGSTSKGSAANAASSSAPLNIGVGLMSGLALGVMGLVKIMARA